MKILTPEEEQSQRRPSVDLSGINVLVVEDMDDARESLRMASAEEGKRLLTEDRPDVMVNDIAMPDDGKALSDAQDLRVPVIAITAHRYLGDDLLAEGFAEPVEKPFDPLTLCRAVLRHTQAAHA